MTTQGQMTVFDYGSTVKKEYVRKKRAEFSTKRYEHGEKVCANCGAGGKLELHHIVPLSRGGQNNPANIIALCHTCHMAAHGASATHNHSGGGRKAKEVTDNMIHAFVEYLDGHKTMRETAEVFGVGHIDKTAKPVRECMRILGVTDYKNNLALILSKRGRAEAGEQVGWYVKDGERHDVRLKEDTTAWEHGVQYKG